MSRDDSGSAGITQIRAANLTPGQVIIVDVYINYTFTTGQGRSQTLTAEANGVATASRTYYDPFETGSCGVVDGYIITSDTDKGHSEAYVPSVC